MSYYVAAGCGFRHAQEMGERVPSRRNSNRHHCAGRGRPVRNLDVDALKPPLVGGVILVTGPFCVCQWSIFGMRRSAC